MDFALEIKAKPGNFRELDQTLRALLPTFRHAKGCRHCRLYKDTEDVEILLLLSRWEAQDSLEHYLRSGNGMVLLGAIDMLSQRASVKTGPDAREEEIDTLKKMRKKV